MVAEIGAADISNSGVGLPATMVDGSIVESKLSGRTTALFLASDLSLVTGLERTFFAALNNVSLIVLTGVGLMMVGNGDKTATGSGISMLGMS